MIPEGAPFYLAASFRNLCTSMASFEALLIAETLLEPPLVFLPLALMWLRDLLAAFAFFFACLATPLAALAFFVANFLAFAP